jgi:hypothetical protein
LVKIGSRDLTKAPVTLFQNNPIPTPRKDLELPTRSPVSFYERECLIASYGSGYEEREIEDE